MSDTKPKMMKVEVVSKSHHAYVDGELVSFDIGEQSVPEQVAKQMLEIGKAVLNVVDTVKEINKAESIQELGRHGFDSREKVQEAYAKKLKSFSESK